MELGGGPPPNADEEWGNENEKFRLGMVDTKEQVRQAMHLAYQKTNHELTQATNNGRAMIRNLELQVAGLKNRLDAVGRGEYSWLQDEHDALKLENEMLMHKNQELTQEMEKIRAQLLKMGQDLRSVLPVSKAQEYGYDSEEMSSDPVSKAQENGDTTTDGEMSSSSDSPLLCGGSKRQKTGK